jgi:hypothetical protein
MVVGGLIRANRKRHQKDKIKPIVSVFKDLISI